MCCKLKLQKILQPSLLLLSFLTSTYVVGKEIKLPSITEVPELKKETMLKDLDIPAVRDRDPDPTAGPRLSVREFRLQGIVEYPELGITLTEVSKIVEDIRFDMMDEGKFLESGYTLEELSEVSDLLVDIEKEVKDRHVGPLEVQKLVWLVREQMAKRGITLGMIETVADRITRYYRENGFILAKAYIPKQQVRDGVVTLSLLLGVLGETKVNNSQLYSNELLAEAFDDVMEKPVTSNAIEERLFLLNDYPGLTTQGFFEAGKQVGDTRLNLNVVSQESYQSNIRIDNHGTEETGENRAYGEFLWNNPTGSADQLHVGILSASSPANTTYGQLRYSSHLIGPRTNFTLGYASNIFVVGRTDQESIGADISGETNIADFNLSYKLKRSRVENHTLSFGHENIESIIKIGDISGLLDDEVENTFVGYDFELLQESNKMLHQGMFRLKQGKFVFGLDPGQDESYTIATADYSLLSFWKFPFTSSEVRSIVRSSLQFSDNTLSSINRFSLGGPTRTRGFDAKVFSADTGIYIGADLFFSFPEFLNTKVWDKELKNIIAPFIFIDGAYGKSFSIGKDSNNNDIRLETEARILGHGLGLQFAFTEQFNAKLQLAYSASEDYETPSDIDLRSGVNETKFLMEFQYRL